MKKKILIFGGTGFIGSNISQRFVNEGFLVTIIDGLCKNTGGRKKNIQTILKDIKFIQQKIEQVKNLENYIRKADVIIDCMGWTSHLSAFKNPQYDLQLNVLSHLKLIEMLRKNPGKKIIYLGSRGQYGNPTSKEITEETKMEPLDVQGIHKLTAENYFRIFSKIIGFSVTSLRLGNCFGVNQLLNTEDIGLIGSFMKDSLMEKEIVLYGTDRKRSFVYAQDVAEVIFQLTQDLVLGFNAYNLVGSEIYLMDLVKKIVDITGSGSVKIEKMPEHIKKIDMGNARVSEEKLKAKLGKLPMTDLNLSLQKTINYFKENL